MQLRYYVPFKAVQSADQKEAQFPIKEQLVVIEGVAIDTSVNKNKWQVPREDLEYIVETLKGAQLRVDHAESALMVVGKVVDASLDGDRVLFRAEVGDERLIDKIIRGYVTHVSIQVDSDEVECSKCKRPTRKEGRLVHLCPGAWEVVRKPKVRELSIVASPAYENTSFQPLGFYAAMNEAQWGAIIESLTKSGVLEPSPSQSSVSPDDNVGSKPAGLQEPETKTIQKAGEVKPMSVNAEQKASPQVAQATVNVAPGETSPKQVEYEDFMKQLEKLMEQIKGETSEEAIEALEAKVRALEAELAKRVKKATLSKKLSELSKRLAELEAKKGEEAEEAEEAEKEEEEAEEAKAPAPVSEAKKKGSAGKGIVAVDALEKDVLANYDWFKDLLKAHRKLVGFQ
jgi:predicted  nucleic acid-binding Zn-ribbon protein